MTYLESLTKFVAHDVVEQWVDAGGQVVQYAGDVGGNHEQLQH